MPTKRLTITDTKTEDIMNQREYTRRKADRSHDTKFVLFLIFALICTSILFYSFGYERGTADTRDHILNLR